MNRAPGKVVWVTGAHGFLGRAIVRRFDAAGWTVGGVGHRSARAGLAADPPFSAIDGEPAWIEASIGSESLDRLLERTGTPAVVVHAAGPGSVGPSLSDPLNDFQLSVGSLAVVLAYLRKHAPEARLVFPSSAAVYGHRPPGPTKENAEIAPISPYGEHKHAAERLCRAVALNLGQPCTVLRFFSLYGPGLTKQLLWDVGRRLAAAPAGIELEGSGEETRDFLHVEDAAELVFLTAAGSESAFDLINGGSGRATSVRQVVSALISAFCTNTRISFTGRTRAGDPANLCADTTRAGSYGFVPRWSLEDGLRSYVDWFRQNQQR